MAEMTADDARGLLQIYLGTLKNESRLTKRVLEAVPAPRSDYRPDPVSKSAIELVRHIAAAEPRFLNVVTTGEFSTQGGIPETAKTPAEIAAWYDEQFTRAFDGLTRATTEQLLKTVNFRGMFEKPAVTFLIMGLHHTIHHRGQLSSYLRSMGAKVPSIYGESYDDAGSRKTAQSSG